MSEIIKKVFQGKELRIDNRDGSLWFVADDVTKGLDLVNGRKAVSTLDSDEKGDVTLSDASGHRQTYNIISEPGFYKLVGKSRKPAAKASQRWVTHEVLPSIRKTGSFNATAPNFDDPDLLLGVVEHLRGKIAAAAYAKQAKDTQLIARATEIKKRAERRVGQILKEMAASGERATPASTLASVRESVLSHDVTTAKPATLDDLGISRTQSARWQGLADAPSDEFGATVELRKRGN